MSLSPSVFDAIIFKDVPSDIATLSSTLSASNGTDTEIEFPSTFARPDSDSIPMSPPTPHMSSIYAPPGPGPDDIITATQGSGLSVVKHAGNPISVDSDRDAAGRSSSPLPKPKPRLPRRIPVGGLKAATTPTVAATHRRTSPASLSATKGHRSFSDSQRRARIYYRNQPPGPGIPGETCEIVSLSRSPGDTIHRRVSPTAMLKKKKVNSPNPKTHIISGAMRKGCRRFALGVALKKGLKVFTSTPADWVNKGIGKGGCQPPKGEECGISVEVEVCVHRDGVDAPTSAGPPSSAVDGDPFIISPSSSSDNTASWFALAQSDIDIDLDERDYDLMPVSPLSSLTLGYNRPYSLSTPHFGSGSSSTTTFHTTFTSVSTTSVASAMVMSAGTGFVGMGSPGLRGINTVFMGDADEGKRSRKWLPDDAEVLDLHPTPSEAFSTLVNANPMSTSGPGGLADQDGSPLFYTASARQNDNVHSRAKLRQLLGYDEAYDAIVTSPDSRVLAKLGQSQAQMARAEVQALRLRHGATEEGGSPVHSRKHLNVTHKVVQGVLLGNRKPVRWKPGDGPWRLALEEMCEPAERKGQR